MLAVAAGVAACKPHEPPLECECGPPPICGQACTNACGCCPCGVGELAQNLVCVSPGCYMPLPDDAGATRDGGPDVSAPDALADGDGGRAPCGGLGHACAGDEICYSTTEGGGFTSSCVPFSSACGDQTPGCGCLRGLCFHGVGECIDVIPGDLIFCTNEGPVPPR